MSFIWVVAVTVLLHCVKATSNVSEVPMRAKRWVTRNRCDIGVEAESSGRTPKEGGPGHQLSSPSIALTSARLGSATYRSKGLVLVEDDAVALPHAAANTTIRSPAANARTALVKLEHGHERFLRDLDRTDPLHASLAFL